VAFTGGSTSFTFSAIPEPSVAGLLGFPAMLLLTRRSRAR
jgi:hypothetical protein